MRRLAALLLLLAAPAWARDYLSEGRSFLAGGDAQMAVESFSEAVRINPFDPVALNNLAVAKAAAGDYQGALVVLERAVKIAPTRADIAANLTHLKAKLDGDAGQPFRLPRGAGEPPEIPPLWRKP